MTVLDLKEKINKRLNIPTENQRLIYCGRILQNEKKLQEYGKHRFLSAISMSF